MNGSDHFKATSNGVGRAGTDSRGLRLLSKSLVAAACALSLAFFGCSVKSGKTTTKVIPTDPNKTDVKAVVTSVDSLVNANKGKGKGVVTGFLTGEGKSIAQGLLKQASNAAGERRLLTKAEIPLTGATVLIFNALKPTTAPDTTLTTDTAGNYTAVLAEGKYFGFAVHLDLETFQLVTTSIPNMNPRADTVTRMDTATAIEDVTAPTVSGVYDAASPNGDGIFLVGSVPDQDAKINITFSEPMSRTSAAGVVLGRIDTSNTSSSMVLADTVKGVTQTWSGDSRELTLSVSQLATGAQYGLILPVGLKDLAKNPLGKEYKATFVTVSAKVLAAVPFSVSSTVPDDQGTLKPIQNPSVSFNRPVEAFSILKNAKIVPAATGYFEISGVRAVFIHKDPLIVGQTYTVTIPSSVTDLSGQSLTKDFSFAFTVKDFEGAAKTSTGRQQEVALAVEAAFDAYLSGDVGRFGAAFSANFRLYDDDGSIKSKSEFLDKIGKDVGDKQAQAAGFPGPVFDNSADACKNNNVSRWKVGADGGTADDVLWVDAYMSPGQSPGVYGADKAVIDRSALTWDPTGPRFTYKGKKYGFGPDMTKFHGPVNMDAAKDDLRFMGTLLQQTSTVVLEDVKLEDRTEFNVDTNIAISGDTARLAVRMVDYDKYNRLNFGYNDIACNASLSDTTYQILKFMLVNDGSKWMITSIVSPSKQTTKADFDKQVDVNDFQVHQILPINLLAPLKDNAADSAGKVAFRFKGIVNDTLGGYIVGIAEDPKFCFGRAPYGALIFVKASNKKGDEESFVLNSAGGPEGTNASMILRRAQDLKLPGWESYLFDNVITTMVDVSKGFGGVYQWKVIAVKDTSAAQFLANGFSPDRYYGESDFGTVKGYFACKSFPQGDAAFNALQANQQQFVSTQTPANAAGSFSDMDLDGVPDNIEIKYKTDPKDRNSYPDFKVDTDGDGIADFLEAMLDPTGKDSLIYKKADAAGVKAELARLTSKEIGIVWQDADGDGFPDDIEMLYGFNPNDPASNPGTHPRANAPIGVFAGKIQMGSSLYDISFKLYTDTAKNLFVTYTAYVGKDTLADTVRSSFNELAGEVYIAVTLPKNGPDAGRALFLRGHYDPNTSLLMGPMDMITAVDKASVNFGGGPNVGQFAASGRGEDVTRYLPQGGTAGTAANTATNNAGPVVITYRQPPTGVSEGSKLVFANGVLTLINDFGDTVGVVDNVQFRSQPDGSIQFNGDVQVNTGADYKRSQVGGTILLSGDGWVVDGSLYQESDSAGIRKQIPGQINGKAAKTDIQLVDGSKFKNPSPQAVQGTFKGWIAQDKTGAGFATVTNPVGNTGNTCDPTKGDCSGNPVCDPTKATCTAPTNCPAGQNCNTGSTGTTTNPTTSFSKTFMAGAAQFKMFLDKYGYKAGDYFFVSAGGHVYKVKYDSTGVQDAKAPLCGQVVLVPELIGVKDATAANQAGFVSDSLAIQTTANSTIFAIEDPSVSGIPALIDKARDAQGDVHANVFVIEMRPLPADYGKATATCQNSGGIVSNPTCDPTKGACPVACDPTKTNCPAVCDSTKGPCGPITGPVNGGGQPVLYVGTLDVVKAALANSQNKVGLIKDSTGNVAATFLVDVSSLSSDAGQQFVLVTQTGATNRFRFVGQAADPKSLIIKDGVPLVIADQNGSGNVPGDTGKVVTNPTDTTKPLIYKGTLENLRQLLIANGGKVKVATATGSVDVAVNVETLASDGTVTTAIDMNSSARIYVFLGDMSDPTKPLLAADGNITVMEKITVAGQ